MSAATVIHGDCIEVMRRMEANSIDAIVTDPPYGLGLFGKAWDELPPGKEWAEECLRLLRPGGHILAFGGSRTWHRLAVAIEDGGFEIRDSIAWMHGNGFPKHRAALKPAFEPIVVGRKPYKGSLAANEEEHGTGALNIEACRIGDEVRTYATTGTPGANSARLTGGDGRNIETAMAYAAASKSKPPVTVTGRWPANVVLDETQAEKLGQAQRFFYVAKASKTERPNVGGIAHPTVKPLSLMQYLIKLVTPEGGTILDPFAGSGTTLEAATLGGVRSVGIERESEYLPLIQARLDRVA